MKRFLFLLFFIPLVASAATQNSSIDSPGDVAILAYNGYDVSPSVVYNDGLTFLLVDDCPNGTTLTITDEEWDGAAFSTPTGEGNLTWTNNTGSTLARGTVIKITNASDDPSTSGIAVNTGSIAESDTGFNMIDGDQLYIYTGTRAAPGVFLAFYGDESTLGNGDTATILGTSLVSGQTAQLNILQGYYNGPASCNSTLSDCLSQIYNTSNWSFTDNPSYPGNLPDTFTGSVFVINNAPTAANFTASPIYQGTPYAFSTANFSYSDTDGDPLDHVRIVTVPGQGSLWVDSDSSGTINGGESALTNGSQVSKANLDAGYLKYLNTTGSSSSFIFDVNDGTAYSAGSYTATLTVTAYPTITLSASSTNPLESVGSVNVTATASHSFNQDITVNLTYSGSATDGADYTSVSSLIITTGNTTKSSALAIADDVLEEATETIIIDISTVSNGTESGTQQQTVSITDNDQVYPTVVISGASGSINAPFTATFTFSEAVIGITDNSYISVTNASVSAFNAVSASVYTALITPTADGAVTVDVAGAVAQDAAGNNNTAATQLAITYDATAPTVVISGASGSINAPFTATFTFSEAVIGITDNSYISVTNASVSAFNAASASVYTALITPTADGAVTVDVAGAVAQDAAGNNNTAATQLAITYDATAPTVVISGASGSINAPFTATFTFSEAVIGITDNSYISVTNASVSAFNAASASVYTALITPTADGAVTVDVAGAVAQDAAGNNNTAATQLAVTYDATAPTVVVSGASGTIGAGFTATFTFSENVTGFIVGGITLTNASGSNFQAVSGSVYTLDITPSAFGLVTVSVAANKASDAAGNNNTAGSLSVDYQNINTDGSVTISGLAVESLTLLSQVNDADGIDDATLTYQWRSGATAVGNSSSYTVAAADVGQQITVQVTYTDNLGRNENRTSAATATVISLQQYSLNTISGSAGGVAADDLTLTQYRQAGLTQPGDDDFNRVLPILNSAIGRSQGADTDTLIELEALVALIMEAQDDDGDGLPNSLEGDVTIDRDRDGIIDREDTDSDQDGLSDRVELGLVLTDSDDDGIIDFFDADADQDGNIDDGRTDDNLDGAEDSLMTIEGYRAANALADADSDGLLNSQDLDSDNDGIGDLIENGLADVDGNLMVDDDRIELDDSNDLIDDNNDGIFNFLQLSSNNIQTDFSLSGLPKLLDVDKDGRIDNTVDMDRDGLMDIIDNAVGAFGSLPDIDGDGIPNHLDEDDDGDGIPDVVENPQMGFFTGKDADADGIDDGVDYDVNGDTFGTDSNGNGVRDDREMPDYDNDGIADHLDPDSDNDNIIDGEDPSINTGDDVTTATGAFGPWMLLLVLILGMAGRLSGRLSGGARALLLAGLLWVPLSQANSASATDEFSADKVHWLLAWGAGYSWLNPEVHSSNKVTDDGGLAGHFAVGVQLNHAWQVRYEYGIPGTAEVNSAPIEYTTHSLQAQYRMPLYGQWSWMLGAGYAHIEADVASGFNTRLESKGQLSLQAGASYPLANNIRVGVQATRYSGDVQTLMVDFSHLIP
ncbi:Ig-like domain-containing protein [Thalassolituus pacificus]|uniref:Ig-like domain-containing protein n=1 Tax=Thalassolituus pacificus TaxID=2975440 RepID=A0A9X2WJ23_9GAMM|nr:Ig-like domain-containing protein [Thalassolituus pacificus]MCT7360732.1 Ig-like domain-containing protein [Thalassolituus pacificus]